MNYFSFNKKSGPRFIKTFHWFAVSIYVSTSCGIVNYFPNSEWVDANSEAIVDIFWPLGWNKYSFFLFYSTWAEKSRPGNKFLYALLILCIIEHEFSCLAFLGVYFQRQSPFYFSTLLLINKLHIKCMKANFSSGPSLCLDVPNSEVLESPVRIFLFSFGDRNCSFVSHGKAISTSRENFESNLMLIDLERRHQQIWEDRREDTGRWTPAYLCL